MVESTDQEALRNVFDAFDLDKSGTIEIGEIKTLSKQLGYEIEDADVQNIFSEIDTNKDGKVSFDEFRIWWHLGKPTKLEGPINSVLKLYTNLGELHRILSKNNKDLYPTSEEKLETHSIRIQAGESEPRTRIGFEAAYCGTEEKTLFEETLGKLGRDWKERSIVLTLASPNPESAKAGLKDLVETALQLMEFFPWAKEILSKVSTDYITTADSISLVIIFKDVITEILSQNFVTLYSLIVKQGTAGHITAEIDLKNDFASMLKNVKDSVRRHILAETLEGFLVDVNLKLSPFIFAYYRKQVSEKLQPGSFGILPYLLEGSKMSVQLAEIPVDKIFTSLPTLLMGTPTNSIPCLGDLVELGKGGGLKKKIQAVPLASKALQFFREHIKASGSLTVRTDLLVATLRIKTSGIKETVDALLGNN